MSLPETKKQDQYREMFDREDFKFGHGVNVISINNDHDKKLKSKAGERLIPVHPELVLLYDVMRLSSLHLCECAKRPQSFLGMPSNMTYLGAF